WDWLAGRCKVGDDQRINREQFRGSDALFRCLDRDSDGFITPDDLDWSPKSAYARQMAFINPWFGALDSNSNGRVSRQEWEEMFNKAASGKDHLTSEDLRRMLYPPSRSKPSLAEMKKMMPSKEMLLTALLQGELGSPFEGP